MKIKAQILVSALVSACAIDPHAKLLSIVWEAILHADLSFQDKTQVEMALQQLPRNSSP